MLIKSLITASIVWFAVLSPAFGKSVDTPRRALELACAYTGFGEVDSVVEVDGYDRIRTVSLADIPKPALADLMSGSTLWEVTLDLGKLEKPGVRAEYIERYLPKTYYVLIDSSNGALVEVRSEFRGSASESPLEAWKASAKNYLETRSIQLIADTLPPVPLIDALGKATGSCHIGSMLTVAVLAMQQREGELRPAWHIVGLGGAVTKLRGAMWEPRPLTQYIRHSPMRTCTHNAVDALTAEHFDGLSTFLGPVVPLDTLRPTVEYHPIGSAGDAVTLALKYSGMVLTESQRALAENTAEKISLYTDSAETRAWRVTLSDVCLQFNDSDTICRSYEIFLDTASSNILVLRSPRPDALPDGNELADAPSLRNGYGLVSDSGIMPFSQAMNHLQFNFSNALEFEVALYYIEPGTDDDYLRPVWEISGRAQTDRKPQGDRLEGISDSDWNDYERGYRGTFHAIDARTGRSLLGKQEI